VGSGAREHALLDALAGGGDAERLYALPGNAGTCACADNVDGVAAVDTAALARWAAAQRIDLTVIGPEAPLVAGAADALAERGLAVFGPTAAAARIEGSKAFAKRVMAAAGVPTARAEVFTDVAAATAALDDFGPPWVVKADGLAAGKGVTVTGDPAAARAAVEAALLEGVHGEAGRRILLEEHLDGPEASVFALSDGRAVLPLAPARDYKRAEDGDRGPNTGGMGAYSPLEDVPLELVEQVRATILEPTVAELAHRGSPYQGLLYAGLALTAQGPKVIEFNCRFGDPETQAILPRLDGSLAALLWSVARGRLDGRRVAWRPEACVTVVLASGGYPGPYRVGVEIDGLDRAAALEGVRVFHAGTSRDRHGKVVTAGGRVLAVTALGADRDAARTRAYEAVDRIRFDGMHYRRDIAASR
jgi:phosphoribosylamine--glycine ligase